jgi:cysteinyl-tRNA synthetase
MPFDEDRFWMHGYFLQLDDAKMAKSTGDFLRLQALIEHAYDPLAYRFFCLSAHYRAKLNFTWGVWTVR